MPGPAERLQQNSVCSTMCPGRWSSTKRALPRSSPTSPAQRQAGRAVERCLEYFPGVDRTLTGYEGLMAAQECLPDNETRDQFAAHLSYVMRLWEAISPDPSLGAHETDYRWLVQVYESVRPVSATGQLLWHRLGAKTVEPIHQNVHVDAVRDDLDTLVVDADLLEAIMGTPDPNRKAREVEIKVAKRLRNHLHDPRFKALADRLEELRSRHEPGVLLSVEFLKELLDLARTSSAQRRRCRRSRRRTGAARPSPSCSRKPRWPGRR